MQNIHIQFFIFFPQKKLSMQQLEKYVILLLSGHSVATHSVCDTCLQRQMAVTCVQTGRHTGCVQRLQCSVLVVGDGDICRFYSADLEKKPSRE